MNNIIKGYKPFCGDCSNLIDGKIPFKCDACPRMMEFYEHNQTALNKVIETAEEYKRDRDGIIEKYNKLAERWNELKPKYNELMKRYLKLKLKQKKDDIEDTYTKD